jgi:hypothetical protein
VVARLDATPTGDRPIDYRNGAHDAAAAITALAT